MDEPFNRIQLTLNEHAEAHDLCFRAYGRQEDFSARHMISGNVNIGEQAIRDMAQATMRQNKTGFFNPQLQAKLSKRPRKQRKTYTRTTYVTIALANGFEIEHIPSGRILKIEPGECKGPADVMEKLITNSFITPEKKEYVYTAFVNGNISKDKRSVFTFNSLRILGIYLPIL